MPRFLTVKEVAGIFRRHPRTIYRWLEEGFIYARKVKDGWLIPYEEVERILAIRGQSEERMTRNDIG